MAGERSMSGPWEIAEARQAANLASAQQKGAENALREAARGLAEAERAYRMSLAQEILRLRADGVAWSSTADLARGDKRVADLKFARDVASGVHEAAQSAAWRHTADRKDVGRFIEWSQRRELAENYLPADVAA